MPQKSQPKQLKVVEVNRIDTTPNDDNSFLECRTDLGRAAFWGSRLSMRNIEAIGRHKLPFTVRCGCVDPNGAWFPSHDVWIPETSELEFIE
jgi:hypothetical protein